MEKEKIQRGIDFRNRLWEEGFARGVKQAFIWWKTGEFNKITFAAVSTVFLINLFIVYPIFQRNVTPSFSSSAALSIVANFFSKFGILSQGQFFQIITIMAVSFAPISFYLFVRKMVLRHELIAFLATILFIMPNPTSIDGPPLVAAILSGDGAHALSFAFIPLLLLYAEAFIATGVAAWGVMSAMATAAIAIVSPFAMFNLIILYTIVAISQGFLGRFRVKIGRMLILLLVSLALSFFWYYPNVIIKMMALVHVNVAIQKFWSVFPLVIPAVPVFGVIFFLIFDERPKLKSVFMAVSLSLIYFFLFTASKSLNITGIFTPQRYALELFFSLAFLSALIYVLVLELLIRKYVLSIKSSVLFFMSIFGISSLMSVLVFLGFASIRAVQATIATKPIMSGQNGGLGTIERALNLNFSSILADIVSLSAFIFLIFILFRFPSLAQIQNGENLKDKGGR